VTFVVTQNFLDHFGLENARDLPGLKELRSAGLLENRPPPGANTLGEAEEGDDDDDNQTELFED
jgi:segregation and condensation protein B